MELVELRVLSGPSAELATPAIRVTFSPPPPGQDAAVLAPTLQSLAQAAGIPVPDPVVVRPGSAGQVVITFPWRRRGTGVALGEALAVVVAGSEPLADLDDRVARAAPAIRDAAPGEAPDLIDPAVPAVAITGTNGKTTTTRLLARIGTAAGLRPGWSSTEGVFVAGECVEPGDWSGPGGARVVLGDPGVSLALLETARGGLMQRGMSVSAVDCVVFTNVSTDHLGLQGLDTVEQLAWAKASVLRIVRPGGWAVLNAEDPLVRGFHAAGPGKPWFFALLPSGPDADFARALDAPLTTVVNDRIVILDPAATPRDVLAVADVPITLAGLSLENVANVLAATSAALALGLPMTAVREGLTSFRPDMSDSAGRMNIWSVPTRDGGTATVILDFAHNEAGTAALLRVARGLRPPGAQVHASIGNAGDRTTEGIIEVARMAGVAADTVQLAAKSRFLRGRTQAEMDQLQQVGLRSVGREATEILPDEPAGLAALLDRVGNGDVVAMMIHQDRDDCVALLAARGAVPDSPETIRAKATRAQRGAPA